MDSIPKAIEDLMANDPNGEVEIVLRRSRRPQDSATSAGDEPPPPVPPSDVPLGSPAVSAMQASLNRGRATPRVPKSYSMPRRAR